MYLKQFISLSLSLVSSYSFALNPLPLCAGANGTAFGGGDGNTTNPYIICNAKQFNRIGQERLTSQSFILGSDIDFKKVPLVSIAFYSGNFDGKGYTLKSIVLNGGSYLAPFATLSNAHISNLSIDNITINPRGIHIGGLAAIATNTTLSNIHIHNLNTVTYDGTGGLVGELNNSLVTQCSVDGQFLTGYGADSTGGLVGVARASKINQSYVNVSFSPLSTTDFLDGITGIGGLVGNSINTQIEDVYAFVNIDYSTLYTSENPRWVGGLVGKMASNSTLNHAYVVGPVLGNNLDMKGAAVGAFYPIKRAIPTNTVFWNKEVSVIQESGLGFGVDIPTMSSANFWLNEGGFNPSIWLIEDNQYPTLRLNEPKVRF